MKEVVGLQVQLKDEDIIKLLSKARDSTDKNNKDIPQKYLKILTEVKKEARTLLTPQGIYALFDSKNLIPRSIFHRSEKTALAICTIGKTTTNRISNLLESGKLVEGVILDAIASVATEDIATVLNQLIITEVSNTYEKYEYSHRFSPGYCIWEMKGQKMIFELLDASKIGVTLSESMMMHPTKSVSFAINFGKKVDHSLGTLECKTCKKANCSHRR